MSPFEMTVYRADFDAACRKLGWSPVVVNESHERESGTDWDEPCWAGPNGQVLFAEDDLLPAMVREIIRLASLMGDA